MSRFLRELQETEGKPSAARRRARGLRALVALLAGSLSSSCLVTNEFAFKTPETPPTVVALSPAGFTRVPNYSDPDCRDASSDALRFDFLVTEPDLEAQVWVRLYVNGGQKLDPIPLPASSDGTATRRTTTPLCIQHSEFQRPCNRVQLVVSHLYSDVTMTSPPADGALNPSINTVQWFVLAKSQNAADAAPSDCAQLLTRDAGAGFALPDATVSPAPSDGGSLLPVGTTPASGDGGA